VAQAAGPEEIVEFYDPTDVFGDLADAIAEGWPDVAPELDDEDEEGDEDEEDEGDEEDADDDEKDAAGGDDGNESVARIALVADASRTSLTASRPARGSSRRITWLTRSSSKAGRSWRASGSSTITRLPSRRASGPASSSTSGR